MTKKKRRRRRRREEGEKEEKKKERRKKREGEKKRVTISTLNLNPDGRGCAPRGARAAAGLPPPPPALSAVARPPRHLGFRVDASARAFGDSCAPAPAPAPAPETACTSTKSIESGTSTGTSVQQPRRVQSNWVIRCLHATTRMVRDMSVASLRPFIGAGRCAGALCLCVWVSTPISRPSVLPLM